MCSESSWRTRIARGLSVRHWGTAAGAAPAAGYVQAGGRLVAIGNIIVARCYYMLVAGGYTVVAAGRHPEDRPLLEGRAEDEPHRQPWAVGGNESLFSGVGRISSGVGSPSRFAESLVNENRLDNQGDKLQSTNDGQDQRIASQRLRVIGDLPVGVCLVIAVCGLGCGIAGGARCSRVLEGWTLLIALGFVLFLAVITFAAGWRLVLVGRIVKHTPIERSRNGASGRHSTPRPAVVASGAPGNRRAVSPRSQKFPDTISGAPV